MNNPSRIFIKANKENLYRFQVANESLDHFLKTLLRSYPGLFTDFVIIREAELAKRVTMKTEQVVKNLKFLAKQGILDYMPQRSKPAITYLQERLDPKNLHISPENYRIRLQEATKRLDAMVSYIESIHKCRSQSLLTYFGEINAKRCGKCDVCLERNKLSLNEREFDEVINRIKPKLKEKPATLEEIVAAASPVHEDKVLLAIRWLLDNEKIISSKDQTYSWK